MKGSLFLIPSPIGNLKEVSPRVLETISICDYIACEDTRNSGQLLKYFNTYQAKIDLYINADILYENTYYIKHFDVNASKSA